jgi:hypothetical protein
MTIEIVDQRYGKGTYDASVAHDAAASSSEHGN